MAPVGCLRIRRLQAPVDVDAVGVDRGAYSAYGVYSTHLRTPLRLWRPRRLQRLQRLRHPPPHPPRLWHLRAFHPC